MKTLILRFLTAGLFTLLLITFETCKKDKEICMACNKCENFPEPGGGISTIKQKTNQRHAPCFNPSNPAEFIYIKEAEYKYSLVKHNLSTKQESILLENVPIVGQPKWGKNGWIVFSQFSDYQIYILQDNGQLLTRITNGNAYLYPEWKNDAIIAAEFSFNLGVPYFYCELNKAGSIVDTFRNNRFTLGMINSIKEKAYLKSPDDPNISLGFENNSISTLTNDNFTGRNRIEGIFWHPNNQDIYYSTYREGLCKVNKNSKNVTKIRNGCDSRSYRFLSISADGKKILVERVDATDYHNSTGSWTEEAKIYIMDIDGKNERNLFE